MDSSMVFGRCQKGRWPVLEPPFPAVAVTQSSGHRRVRFANRSEKGTEIIGQFVRLMADVCSKLPRVLIRPLNLTKR